MDVQQYLQRVTELRVRPRTQVRRERCGTHPARSATDPHRFPRPGEGVAKCDSDPAAQDYSAEFSSIVQNAFPRCVLRHFPPFSRNVHGTSDVLLVGTPKSGFRPAPSRPGDTGRTPTPPEKAQLPGRRSRTGRVEPPPQARESPLPRDAGRRGFRHPQRNPRNASRCAAHPPDQRREAPNISFTGTALVSPE